MRRLTIAGWPVVPLAVGCHWACGPYTVSTISQGDRFGYAVYRDRQAVGEFLTWAEVEALISTGTRTDGVLRTSGTERQP